MGMEKNKQEIIHNYVLMTENNTYFVECLLGQLIISESLTEAMVFSSNELAEKFK